MLTAVGISCGELARFSMFYDSLMQVRGVTNENVIQARSSNIAGNRNAIAEIALARGYEAIWYVDDDQVFQADCLERLQAHDKDAVSGLYLKREPPFRPNAHDQVDERGWAAPMILKGNGLVECKAVGAGCLLVKTKVLQAMAQPWWRLGQTAPDLWGDDLDFCRRVREAGFTIHCDLSVRVGHALVGVLWPAKEGEKWATMLTQGQDVIAVWPQGEQ